jgi:DNA polymerase I-like protein with 3'-5' exonuclease and polymerase domains
MNYLILDTETTTKNSGNPFDQSNRLCIISYATSKGAGWVKVEYDDEPYAQALSFIQSLVDESDLLVFFNAKFDLHWLRRYGINFVGKRIWDCQLAHFMLDYQRNPMPSLDDACMVAGVPGKSGNAVADLWDAGVDTPDIPLDVLTEYAVDDAIKTAAVYHWQVQAVKQKSRKFANLVALHNADLLVTQEMEWNGLLLDVDECHRKAEEIGREVADIDKQLSEFFGHDWINWGSSAQLSAIIFGGKLTHKWKEQVDVYKTGAKIGLPRYKWFQEEHEFPRLAEPAKGTELASGGWSTAEDHLRSLRPRRKSTRPILDLLLKRAELEKLRGTYYLGLPEILSTMGWKGNYLHGQINHVIARTGRTSSSKPNLQNIPAAVDKLFRSRFGELGQLVGFDAKGLEWVCIVYQSQDPVGIEEIKAGVNQHEMNRDRFGLPSTRVAKFFVFRLIYGGQAYAFTVDPDFSWVSDSKEFWQDVMDKFYEKYKAIDKVHVDWYNNAIYNGKFVTPSGREFIFTAKDGEWKGVRPVILNYPVQSFGADLMAIARVSLFKRMQALDLKSKLINTIHDSIVLDIFNEEWYTISTLVKQVFDDIPKNFEKLFGESFNLPMKAEAKRLDGEEINENSGRNSSLPEPEYAGS